MTSPTKRPGQHGLHKSKDSLRTKLVASHMSVAGMGLASLAVAILGALAVQRVAVRLAEERGPTVHEAMRATAGVHHTLAAMRAWVAIGDPVYITERLDAWREEVEPAMKRLDELSVNWTHTEDVARLRRLDQQLKRLKESQWWVEDVAQTPGNEPARLLVERDATPISETIFRAISDCINVEKEQPPEQRRDLLGAMADFRGYFTRSRAELASFADHAAKHGEQGFRSSFAIASTRLNYLVQEAPRLLPNQQELIHLINQSLPIYEKSANQALATQEAVSWNVARQLLAQDAAPKAAEVIRLLGEITRNEKVLMAADSRAVTKMNHLTIALGGVLMLGLLAVAWITSSRHAGRLTKPIAVLAEATRRMAGGDLRQDLPVTTTDELGDLTTAFNSMRKSLDESHSKMRESREIAIEAGRAKSEFLANMSHEIRTPMNAIIGLTGVVLKSEIDATQRDYLETVSDSADQLLTIINDILDFSKVESGRMELDHNDFQIRDLVGDTLRALALKAHQQGVELTFRVTPDVPCVVVGDPVRLRQVLTNLVSNAIRFTDAGQIALEVKRAEQPGDPEGHVRLGVTVEDTGIGIPKDKLKSIFNAFEQVDGSSTRRYGGTGLGLSVSSRLVEQMGGQIVAESELGSGSVFRFTACLGKSDREVLQPWQDVEGELEGKRVLIVDDNRTNRVILTEIADRRGMLSTSAGSASDALRLLNEAQQANVPFDLIVSDVHMPECDGHQLCEKIRQTEEGSSTPIVLLTSTGDLGDAARVRALGIAARLTKPAKESELVESFVGALGLTKEAQVAAAASASDEAADAADSLEGLKILLVEDSLPNQKIALALLGRFDNDISIAENGREALEMIGSEAFDVVLMDVQMPLMDGFEATRRLRAAETQTGAHVPVVAMTAHALKGDRERCLEAGMDAYVSKPITEKNLWESIRVATSRGAVQLGPPKTTRSDLPSTSLAAPIPWNDLLAEVSGKQEVFLEIVDAYSSEIAQTIERLASAVEGQDAPAVQACAHKIKSGLWYFKQSEAASIAESLEIAGERGEISDAPSALDELQTRVEATLVLLKQPGAPMAPELPA